MEGDVRSFHLPDARFTHVIHAASDATPQLCIERPLLVLDTIVDGTRRVLDFAVQSGAKRFLFTSSGAVYGRAAGRHAPYPRDLCRRSRPDGAAVGLRGGQAHGRDVVHRLRAQIVTSHACRHGASPSSAPIFRWTPISPSAISSATVPRAGPIRVNGDGTPVRSYLYAADLAIWLWTMLVAARREGPTTWDRSVPFLSRSWRDMVAGDGTVGASPERQHPGRLPERYVPSCERARTRIELDRADSAGRRHLPHHAGAPGKRGNVMTRKDTITRPLFIFEMANNHMGDVEHGLRIIRAMHDVACEFPFDFGFKLQYRQLDTFIHPALPRPRRISNTSNAFAKRVWKRAIFAAHLQRCESWIFFPSARPSTSHR